jgi:predicted phage tail protein
MAKLAIIRNPFNYRDRIIVTIDSAAVPSLNAHLQDQLGPEFKSEDFHISRNGESIATESVPETFLNERDWICVVPRVAGGGGGGKNPLKIIALIAFTALAFGGLGGGGGIASFFGKAAGKNLLLGAAMLLGGALLSGMSKRPNIDIPTTDGSAWENSPQWDTATPRTVQGSAVPLTYGTVRVNVPQVINQRVSTDGQNQYLNLLMCGGEGPIDSVSDVRINGQSLDKFAEIADGTTREDLDETIDPAGTPTVITTTGSVKGFYLHRLWPNGVSTNGALVRARIKLQYRKQGASTWINFPNTPNGEILMMSTATGTNLTGGGDKTNGVENLDSAIYEIQVTLTPDFGPLGTLKINGISYLNYESQPVAYTRTGTNNQTIIPYFDDTYADQSLGIALTTSYQSYETESTAAEGLIITVEFPQGLGYVKDDGEMQESWVDVQAQYRKSGAASWTDWATWRITGDEKKTLRRQFRIDDLDSDQYEVQVKIADREGTTGRYVNDCVWTILTSVIYDDFAYPGYVLVGLRALATNKLSGSAPRITWSQTRANVYVYDPTTSAYVEKSATNPAWIIYDMIHRCRKLRNIQTGLDEYLVQGDDHTQIDYDAFEAWADFCDELVDGEKRCECNIYLDSPNQLWSQIQTVAEVGRGSVVLIGTKWSAVWDEASDPVQLFSVGNIEIDSLTGEYLSLDARAGAIECSFLNEQKDYQRDTLTVYSDTYDASDVTTTTQVFFPGLTNYQRVYRAAAYRLRLNKYLKRTITFGAEVDAIACQVGDVILVQHDVSRWGEGGRIVSATSSKVTLDKELTLAALTDYQIRVRHSDDTLEVATIAQVAVPTTTATLTLTGTWTTIPTAYSVYSFGLVDLDSKPFRVIAMERRGDLRCRITALEYYPEVYDETLTVPTIDYTTAQAAITDLRATFDWDATGNGYIEIAWTASRDNYGGAVIVVNAQYAGRVGSTESSYRHYITSDGDYLIHVQGLSTVGLSTGIDSTTCQVQAYSIPAVTVTDLIEDTYILNDGTALTDVTVEFGAEYFRFYGGIAVYYKLDGAAAWTRWYDTGLQEYAPARTASGTIILKSLKAASTVQVDVRMVSTWGTEGQSNPSAVLNIVGKSAPPGDVQNFTAVQEKYGILLDWDDNADVDLSEYVVRLGASWAAGTQIYRGRADYVRLAFSGAGTYTYWVKAIDRSGNYSVNAATATVTVTAPATPVVTAVAINGGIRLSIAHAQNTDFSHYIVERQISGGGSLATINATLVSMTLDDTDIATLGYVNAYQYRVTAVDRNGATGSASAWSTAVTPKKIQTLDITSDQLVGLDLRTTCDAGGGAVSGVKITTAGVEGYNGSTRNTFIDAVTGTICAQNGCFSGHVSAASGAIAGWTICSDSLQKCNATLHSGGYLLLGSSNDIVRVDAVDATYRLWAGHATAASAPFRVTKAGAVTATNATITGTVCACAGNIGGWTLGNGCIVGGNAGLYSAGFLLLGTGNDVARVDACDATHRLAIGHATMASAPFRVTKAGALTATSATITGTVCAATGHVGCWTLGTGTITGGNAVLCNTGILTLGTGNDVVIASASDATYRLWAGHAAASCAPFSVTKAGLVTATSGNVGGWCLCTNCLYGSGAIVARTSTNSIVAMLSSVGIYLGCDNHSLAPFCVNLAGNVKATSGCIGGWVLNPAYICSGTTILCCTGLMTGGGFFSGNKGWRIDATGNAEFNSAVIRGEMRASLFSYDDISAIGGQALIVPAGQVLTCVTSPAAAGTSFNLDVKDPESGHVQLFGVGDILRVKTWNGTSIADVWGAVASVTNCTTYYRYAVTLCSGTSAVIPANTAVVSYGTAAAGGGIMLAGQGTCAPYIDIFQTGATPWAGVTSQVRIGQLSGTPAGAGWGLWTCNASFSGGILQSSNWAACCGSCINLNTGVFAFGGCCSPLAGGISWDGNHLRMNAGYGSLWDGIYSQSPIWFTSSTDARMSLVCFDTKGRIHIAGASQHPTYAIECSGVAFSVFQPSIMTYSTRATMNGCGQWNVGRGAGAVDWASVTGSDLHVSGILCIASSGCLMLCNGQICLNNLSTSAIPMCIATQGAATILSMHDAGVLASGCCSCIMIRGYDCLSAQQWSLGTYGNAGFFWLNCVDNLYFGTGNATRLCLTNTLATLCTPLSVIGDAVVCGTLAVGHTGWVNPRGLGQKIESHTTQNYGGLALYNWSNASADTAAILDLSRSRGATVGSYTAVTNNDVLGAIVFRGANGTAIVNSVGIAADVDGTPSGGYVPGRLRFGTSDGTALNVTRAIINSSGNMTLGATDLTGGTETVKLHIAGDTRVKSTDSNTRLKLQARDVGISANIIDFQDGNAANKFQIAHSQSANQLLHYANGVISRILNSSGNTSLHSSDCAGSTYRLWVGGDTLIKGNLCVHTASSQVSLHLCGCSNEHSIIHLMSNSTCSGWRIYRLPTTCSGTMAGGFLLWNCIGSKWPLLINCVNNVTISGDTTTDLAGATTRLLVNMSCSTGTVLCVNQAHSSAGNGLAVSIANNAGFSGSFGGGNYAVCLGATSNCFLVCNLGTGTGTAVVLNAGGCLLCSSSSITTKTNVHLLVDAPWKCLLPVTFAFCSMPGVCRYGLIAEHVNEVAPWLVNCDKYHRPTSVDYDGVATIALAGVLRNETCLESAHKIAMECIDNLEKRLAALELKG